MAFELNGIIIEIFPAQTFNKGFRKREFVIESGDKYPQKIVFGLVQDKCDMIDSYGIGDTVSVAFDVKGRDWTDKSGQTKYFNSLEAYRINGQQRANVSKPASDFDDEDDGDADGGAEDGRRETRAPDAAQGRDRDRRDAHR